MTEAKRQQYLGAMGIPLWYSRFRLPGAHPTQALDFSDLKSSAVGVVKAEPSSPIPRLGSDSRSASRIAAELVEATRTVSSVKSHPDEAVTPVVDTSAAAVVPVSLQAQDSAVPGFCVRAYELGAYVVLNTAHESTEVHRESALLANLASGLGLSSSVGTPSREFAWPVFSNRRLVGQSADKARHMLANEVSDLMANAKGVVIMGDAPIWPSLPKGAVTTLASALASGSVPTLVTFSLGDLLLQQERKKEVWHHLLNFIKKEG